MTELGELPVEWGVRSIGDMFTLVNGCAFKPEDWKTTGTPIIRIQNLNDLSAPFNFSQAPVPERNRVEPGDLLFAWSGTLGTSFGARVWQGPAGVLNQHIFKVLMDDRRIDPSFALVVFARIADDIAKQAHGFKASFVHVRKSDLVKVMLPVPPLDEQRAIAAALNDVDALIEAQDRLTAKKRDLKQAAMQQLLTGKTRLPGFSDEWEVKRIRELGEVVTGGTPRTDVDAFWGGEYPWVTPTDISMHRDMSSSERTLTQKGLDAIRALPPNTVLVTCIASIGKNALLVAKGACNQQINAIVPHPSSDAAFIYYMIEASKQYLLANSGITATRILSKKLFSELTFSVPTHSEQTAIAAVLTDMDAELTALEQRLDKTRLIKQGMMQELLTGRTRLIKQGMMQELLTGRTRLV